MTLHIKLIPTHRKNFFLLINSIYLVFSFLETQRKLIQTEVYSNRTQVTEVLLYLQINNLQTFKSIATAKNLLSSARVIGTTCFDSFFVPCDNWKALLFINVYSEFLSNHGVLAFFETSDLIKILILFFIAIILITKLKVKCKHHVSKIKLSYIILIKFS